MSQLPSTRAREILEQGSKEFILVVGDVMLDSFVSGSVSRISPEAPVPVLRYESESLMPGGAANVARNLTALGAPTSLFSLIGKDQEGRQLKKLLEREKVNCKGLKPAPKRATGTKTRIVAQQQQIVRVDREVISDLTQSEQSILEKTLKPALDSATAIIIGDYGKGMITDSFLSFLKTECQERGIWLSLDPNRFIKWTSQDSRSLPPIEKRPFNSPMWKTPLAITTHSRTRIFV